MLGAWKARVAPFNVNYRYVADELRYLLDDAGATAIVVHSRFAPTLAEVLPDLPRLRVIIQVPDDSGHDLLPGAVWYEDALAAASPRRRPTSAGSPDDLYILYTGGTTGMPKGVLWRNGDAMVECFGGSPHGRARVDGVRRRGRRRGQRRPEGADHPAVHARRRALDRPARVARRGHRVPASRTPSTSTRPTCGSLVEREGIEFMLIVGDAFARPLLDELDRQPVRPVEPERRALRRRARCRSASSRSCSATSRR